MATAIEGATLQHVEEVIKDFQTLKSRARTGARNFLNHTFIRNNFIFAIFCINPSDPGLCNFPQGGPVIGPFVVIYNWWKKYGDCNVEDYTVKVFRKKSDALYYVVSASDQAFSPNANRGKIPTKATKAAPKVAKVAKVKKVKTLEIPNYLKHLEEVTLEVIKTRANFEISEIIPEIKARLKMKFDKTYAPPTLRKMLYLLFKFLKKDGILSKSPDFKRIYIVSE